MGVRCLAASHHPPLGLLPLNLGLPHPSPGSPLQVKRKAEIPIVQLNPGGTLNHKYTAEMAVRSSGYPYTVVRCTGRVMGCTGRVVHR